MTEGPELPSEFRLTAGPGTVSRRKFLSVSALAGASLGVGAAACTHPAAVGQASARVSALRTVSAPRWTAAIGGAAAINSFASLGATIVAWRDTEAQGFDAATGAAAWTVTPGTNSATLDSAWWGVFGETLTGISSAAGGTLVGYDAAGRRTLSLGVSQAFREAGIVTADRDIGCVGVGNGVAVIVAVTKPARAGRMPPPFVATLVVGIGLADGKRRWSREVTWYEYALLAVQSHLPLLGGTVSGNYCYVQDGEAVRAIELSTGAVRWSRGLASPPPVLNPGPSSGTDISPSMSVADGVLVLSNEWEYVALDAGSGAQLWTMRHMNTANLVTGANRVYILDPDDRDTTVEALDSRTGKKAWSSPAPPSLTSEGGVEFLTSASSSLVVGALYDGILVLSAADGQPLWAYRHPVGQWGDPAWKTLMAGSAVYGLESIAYGNYGAQHRLTLYAFPPTAT